MTDTITLPGVGDSLAIGVDPCPGKIYLGGEQRVSSDSAPNTSYLAVIDKATDSIVNTINMANYPQGIAVDPIRGTVYMTAGPTAPYYVYAIDEQTDAVTATIPSTSFVFGVGIDPVRRTVCVSAKSPCRERPAFSTAVV